MGRDRVRARAAATTALWARRPTSTDQDPDARGDRVFIAFSALSGAAQSIGGLIAFRALQGVGAGGVMTLAWQPSRDLVPPRERGRYRDTSSSRSSWPAWWAAARGSVRRPLSWRWAFYVERADRAVAPRLLTAYLPASERAEGGGIDFAGSALLAGAVVVDPARWPDWGGMLLRPGTRPLLGSHAAASRRSAIFSGKNVHAANRCCRLRLFSRPGVAVVQRAAVRRHPFAFRRDRVPAAVPAARDGERDRLGC